LEEYLRTYGQEIIYMHFSELEAILGFTLPMSAYTYRAWWANGRHSQANAWLHAGYKVDRVDIPGQALMFRRVDALTVSRAADKKTRLASTENTEAPALNPKSETTMVCGYEFHFIQELIPECDAQGNAVKYYPQNKYDNKKRLPLSYYGTGAFCRFSINAGNSPGVYLWVVGGQIIYIGETAGLQQRFNMGYGVISPRNCYVGGQSTNCRMNKVLLDYYELGKTVSLYFYATTKYKQVELELLRQIHAPYNAEDI
jgi:hypothetical protein